MWRVSISKRAVFLSALKSILKLDILTSKLFRERFKAMAVNTTRLEGHDIAETEKLSAEASDNPKFSIDKSAYTIVKEGKAEVLFPSSHDVFYNPVQEFNRDVSIAVIRQYTKEFLHLRRQSKSNAEDASEEVPEAGKPCLDGVTILEALAASGLRSIRYAMEIPGVKRIIANDASLQAVESISRNIKYNKVGHMVSANEDDAVLFMHKKLKHERFNIVDIDPYGSPTTFLDAAVQAVHDGGLLMVTCTDLAVLCGNCSETCHSKYGAISLKCKHSHEMAIRIVLQCIESHANRYGRYIVPLLSLSVDFYLRIFVKVHVSPSKVKQSASKLALVFQCIGCDSFILQPMGRCIPSDNGKNFKYSPSFGPVVGSKCLHCDHRYQLGGPVWADKLHSAEFVEKILDTLEENPNEFKTAKRIHGMLSVVKEELPDIPLFYVLDRISSVLHTICPKIILFRSALLNAGYKVSYSHTHKASVKTDAPSEFIWDIMRHWAKQHPVERKVTDDSPSKVILSKEPTHEVSFEIHPEANPESRTKGLVRFQQNPEKFWGPKMRAKTSFLSGKEHDKKTKMQGKRCRPEDGDKRESRDLKAYPCKRFKKGKCDRGENCKYSHSVDQLSESSISEENGNSKP